MTLGTLALGMGDFVALGLLAPLVLWATFADDRTSSMSGARSGEPAGEPGEFASSSVQRDPV